MDSIEITAPTPTPIPCSQTGMLVFEEYCYALKCDDGTEYWLEMDNIPSHLVDGKVSVAGKLYDEKLLSVELIGPA